MKKKPPSETALQFITLYDFSHESPSGHTETYRSASLGIDSHGNVVLHEKYQHLDFLHTHNHETYDRKFKIKIEKLEELIKEHGKGVADNNKRKKTANSRNRS